MSIGGAKAPAPVVTAVPPLPPVEPVAQAAATKPVPPPAQLSGSLQAAQGQVNQAKSLVGGGAGGTVLTSPGGVRMPGAEKGDSRNAASNAAMLLYGKTLTGA